MNLRVRFFCLLMLMCPGFTKNEFSFFGQFNPPKYVFGRNIHGVCQNFVLLSLPCCRKRFLFCVITCVLRIQYVLHVKRLFVTNGTVRVNVFSHI